MRVDIEEALMRHAFCPPLIFMGQEISKEEQRKADEQDIELAQFLEKLEGRE